MGFPLLLFFKSHIKGFTRKDGVYVAPHENKVVAAHKAPKALWAGAQSKAPLDPAAYDGIGAPDHMPPAPSKPLASPMEAPPKVVGAQFGGSKPQPKKWKNSLTGWPYSRPRDRLDDLLEDHSERIANGSKEALPYPGSKMGKYQPSLFMKPKHYPNAIDHPQMHDDGKPIKINEPEQPSAPDTWANPKAVALFTPGSEVPSELNGVPFKEWSDAPTTEVGWHFVAGQNEELEEPDLHTNGKKPAAGVLIEEPDGRVWLMNPTNGFGGYDSTFPKGRIEHGMSMQASAIKEAFEETGLQIEITGYLGDIERTQTMARYYTARRVGGTPKAMGWESQAVQLVPKDKLHAILNQSVDRDVASMAGIHPPEPKPEPSKSLEE